MNAKQCRIYKVVLNGQVEASFQYFDPMLDVVQGVSHQYDAETYSDVHVKGKILDPQCCMCVVVPYNSASGVCNVACDTTNIIVIL